MSLGDNNIKSELSYAFLHAVATRAGCECVVSGRHSDDAGVDARLFVRERFGPRSTLVRFSVEIQLKATSTPLTLVGDQYSFPLTVKHYDKLRDTEAESPLLLIVFQMPPAPEQWLTCTSRALTLRRCAYWASLYNAPASANDQIQTVYLRKRDRFSIETLRSLLERFSRQERIAYVS